MQLELMYGEPMEFLLAGSQPTLFSLLSARSSWLQARHAVLTQNVANADTPGYLAKDLQSPKFEDLISRMSKPDKLPLAQTAGSHLSGTAINKISLSGKVIENYETAPNGNSVVLEDQVRKLGDTKRQHEIATNIYGKYVSMMRAAIGTN